MMVRCDNLLPLGDRHQGLADVGEVLPRDDLDVRDAAVRQEARPGIQAWKQGLIKLWSCYRKSVFLIKYAQN